MRLIPAGLALFAFLVAAPAAAQTMNAPPPPPPAAMPPPPPPEGTPAPPPPPPPAGSSPAPATPTVGVGADLTGTPNPTELSPSAGDEFRFSSHGFTRAPMRIGIGNRPGCPAGTAAGTVVGPSGGLNPTGFSVPCAGSGESTTNFHTPMVPDDQYLDPRYTRQWEKDWTEVFLNYGNSHIVGTVAFQAWGLTDAEHLSTENVGQQLGIAQAYVTLTPSLGKLHVKWKVGSFWDKYGMSGKYDAGKYDTYMFGRTHTMGETLAGELDVDQVTLKLAHGIGVKDEELEFSALTPAYPGFTLLNHVHAGFSYKKMLDVNVHYLEAWAQDARVETGPQAGVPDGMEDVAGMEARFTGGIFGELYVAGSRVRGSHVQQVGPALEVIHSLGGWGQDTISASGTPYYGPNGLMDNYLGTCPNCTPNQMGTGHIDTILIQYDYSFGLLARKLKNPGAGFWGDGPDVTLNLFGMYQAVSSTDTSKSNPLVGDGVKKLKYGADLVVSPISWMGVGVRGDIVNPTNLDSHQSFGVLSPKLIFKSHFVTHEEITAQYSHYFDGVDVAPQPPYGIAPTAAGAPFTGYPPDKNAFGIKCTLWW